MTRTSMMLCIVLASACATSPDDDALGFDDTPLAPPPVLNAPAGQWTWFDIPGAVCGYGQQTGIGVSVGTGTEVLIYLEGGGLCWDELSCNAKVPPLPPVSSSPIVLASYFTGGFTAATFNGILAGGGYSTGIFDRTLPNNPYKTATQIYVPYCTGDVHTGRTQQYFPLAKKLARFNGRQNLDLALAAIVQSFPSVSRVTLSGTSAGAYGATFNFGRVQEAFGATRVDLVADSGPIFPLSPFLQQGYPVWDTNSIVPSDCPECVASYANLYAYYARTYPASRFAVLTHDQDLVIAAGHLLLPYPGFYFVMKQFTQQTLGALPNWRSFVAAGTGHGTLYDILEPSIQKRRICRLYIGSQCFLYDPFKEIELSRTVLADWLTAMATDSPNWTSKTSINQ